MRVDLVQAIILACQLHYPNGYNATYTLKHTTDMQNSCVMAVGVCIRNKEIECEGKGLKDAFKGHDTTCEYGMMLLNCVVQKREWHE